MSDKHKVTVELIVKHTYEVDLDSEAYEHATTVFDALQVDAGNAFEDPVEWLELFSESNPPVIVVRAREHGTIKNDIYLEDTDATA